MAVGAEDCKIINRGRVLPDGVAAAKAKPKSVTTDSRTKTSVSLAPKAKFKLSTLKAELRMRGHSATESSILEALILNTDASTVARLLRAG